MTLMLDRGREGSPLQKLGPHGIWLLGADNRNLCCSVSLLHSRALSAPAARQHQVGKMENNSVRCIMSKSRMEMQQVPLEIPKARGTKPSLVLKSIKELQAMSIVSPAAASGSGWLGVGFGFTCMLTVC